MLPDKPLNDLTLNELLEKAKEIQGNMKAVQSRLDNACVTGIAGNQDVQIKITGKYRVVSTFISDSALEDKNKLANLVTIAINDAIHKLELIAEG